MICGWNRRENVLMILFVLVWLGGNVLGCPWGFHYVSARHGDADITRSIFIYLKL